MSTAAKRKPREEVVHEASDYAKRMVQNALNAEAGVAPLLAWIGMLEHAAFVAPLAKSNQLIQSGVDRGLDDGFILGYEQRAIQEARVRDRSMPEAEIAVIGEAARQEAKVLVEQHNAKKRGRIA